MSGAANRTNRLNRLAQAMAPVLGIDGHLPLSVRYGAAEAALVVIEAFESLPVVSGVEASDESSTSGPETT